MKVMYIVAIKHLKDRNSNGSEHWEYAYTDFEASWDGSFIYFNDYLEDSNQFDTVEAAEKWFRENKRRIYFTDGKDNYDMESVCIKKVFVSEPIYKFEKSLSFNEV